jgi:hypothetical protein
MVGRGSSVGIATGHGLDGTGVESGGGEIFRIRLDRPWGTPSLLYNEYRVIPRVIRAGRGVYQHPSLAMRLKKE